MGYRTTRRNFIQQCSCSIIAFSAPQCMCASPSEVGLQSYTIEQYMHDVRSVGLCATWQKICDSFIQYGEPKSGPFVFPNIPHLYRQGCELAGKNIQLLHIQEQVSRAIVSYLKRCSGDGLCGLNCGIGIHLLDYLSTLEYSDVRRIVENGLLRLFDTDQLAMRICATAIEVRYKLQGLGKVEQTWIRPDQQIALPEGLRTCACDAGDGSFSISCLLDKAPSAVVLTSRSVDVASMKATYPAEIRNWVGSVMTFGSPGERSLALIVIESKSNKGRRHDIV